MLSRLKLGVQSPIVQLVADGSADNGDGTLSHRVPKLELLHHRSAGLRAETVHPVLDAERRLVTVTFGRKLGLHEIQRYARWLLESSSFDPTFSEIVDLSQVEEVDLNAEEFLKLADKVDPFSTVAKRAFVARNAMQNHAARMHKVLGTGRRIEIFHSVEEAEQWICTAL